jgi:general stress protein YciG
MAKKKNSAAVELGRLGGQKKVPKGFSTMDPDLRAEAGRKGAAKRWGKKKK